MEVLIGDIMCFAFPFAPSTWKECNGQTLSIAAYQTLYSIIGNTFGGDGYSTFCVPNLTGASRHNAFMKFYIATEGMYPSRS